MSQYFLSNYVHVCVTDDHAVFLDVRKHKYLGLSQTQSLVLGEILEGWPKHSSSDASFESLPDDEALLVANALLQKGLLTTDRLSGRGAVPIDLSTPSETLLDRVQVSELDIRPAHVYRFLASAARAALLLRWRPFHKVVQRVARRRKQLFPRTPYFMPADSTELVAIFMRLRPLAFTSRERCLFDSLALIEFLAGFGLFPRWIFGVQTRPFGAHCWVQDGSTVLNDFPDHVRAFTPIMSV